MIERQYLDNCLRELRNLKSQAEKAIAQIEDEQIFAVLDPESNSIALIMKHMAGNMRSRWTDFLTSDGEKPDRNRDAEFDARPEDTRDKIFAAWEDGWSRLFHAVSSLSPEDLDKTVKIRGKSLSVLEAVNRQLTHYAAHVGQIVLLAKHYAGADWQSLSIPKNTERSHQRSRGGAGRRGPASGATRAGVGAPRVKKGTA